MAKDRTAGERELLRRIKQAKTSCDAETASTKRMLSGKFRGKQYQ